MIIGAANDEFFFLSEFSVWDFNYINAVDNTTMNLNKPDFDYFFRSQVDSELVIS